MSNIDISIFEKYHEDYLESLKDENYFRSFLKPPGPFKYRDFNARSKAIIDFFVNRINEKYNKHYLSKRASDIKDDGSPDYIWIGLWDKSLRAKSFYVIFLQTGDVLDADSFNQSNYAMSHEQVESLKEEVFKPNDSNSTLSALEELSFDLRLALAGKIPLLELQEDFDNPQKVTKVLFSKWTITFPP